MEAASLSKSLKSTFFLKLRTTTLFEKTAQYSYRCDSLSHDSVVWAVSFGYFGNWPHFNFFWRRISIFQIHFTSLLHFPVSFSPDQCDKQKLGHFPKFETRYRKYFLEVIFKFQNSLVRLVICVNNLEKIGKKYILYLYNWIWHKFNFRLWH